MNHHCFIFFLFLSISTSSCSTNTTCDLHNYRLGSHHQCHSEIACWTCVELLSQHYNCAERNNITIYNVSRHLGTKNIGDYVSWQAPQKDNLPTSGWWNNCRTSPTLYNTGLTFHDNGKLEGFIAPSVTKAVWFTAYNTNNNVLTQLNLHLYVNTHTSPTVHSFETVHPIVSKAADQAVASYKSWENRQTSHTDVIAAMNRQFQQMKTVLDQHPNDGFGWGILGALHMNTHKLLENVLIDAEHYLGYALSFRDSKLTDFVETNLEGCYAKRLLEAAKFIWITGMQETLKGIDAVLQEREVMGKVNNGGTSATIFMKAEELFVRAVSKKKGWGWGVNNGEIFLCQATVKLFLSRDKKEACQLVELAADRNARLPWTIFLQQFCKKSVEKNNLVEEDEKVDEKEKEMRRLITYTKQVMENTLLMVQPKTRSRTDL